MGRVNWLSICRIYQPQGLNWRWRQCSASLSRWRWLMSAIVVIAAADFIDAADSWHLFCRFFPQTKVTAKFTPGPPMRPCAFCQPCSVPGLPSLIWYFSLLPLTKRQDFHPILISIILPAAEKTHQPSRLPTACRPDKSLFRRPFGLVLFVERSCMIRCFLFFHL